MEIKQGNRAKLLSEVYGPEFTKETKSIEHWPCTGSLLYIHRKRSHSKHVSVSESESL